MITKIIKRDGREAPFNIEKISNAITKAFLAIGAHNADDAMELACEVAERIENETPSGEYPTVEQIQNMVENVLMQHGYSRAAKEYILYRAERSRIREMNTDLMKIYEDLTFKDAADNDVKRENANIDGDTAMGTMLKYGSEGAKKFDELFVLDPKVSAAHVSGDIHVHDLDFYTLTTTCCQIDLTKLFRDGFSTGHGHIREPQDIQSYSALACIAIQSNQNDQHGGQSVPAFDYDMSEGVRKSYAKIFRRNFAKAMTIFDESIQPADAEKLAKTLIGSLPERPALRNSAAFEDAAAALFDAQFGENAQQAYRLIRRWSDAEIEKAVYQAMEALIHNLNTMHSRAGAQIPFSSLNYGTDTSPEGRMVMRQLLLATDAGLGNGETPIFPIQIFKVKEGVNYNPGDPNYDLFKLACKVSAKRLFPNFSFLDAPFNKCFYKEGDYNTEVAYMGCRTRVMANAYDPSQEVTAGRGNLSFTSVNLPRLAIRAAGSIDAFFEMLDEKIDLIIGQLLHRFRIQASKRVRNSPFLMGEGIWLGSEKLGPDDTVGEILKHGTLTLGFIGLAECLKALTGRHHGESKDAQNLGLEIVSHMRARMDEATERYGLNFSLIATPAEGLSGRFTRLDKAKYGIIEGVTDREYYTNSFHVPVYYPITAFEKISIEAPYHELTNGGHISYVELDGDPTQNLGAFEALVRHMKESGIGYGSINHPVDRDPVCGYTGIIGDTCPRCGRKEGSDGIPFERIRRITGYLVGTLDKWNNAKKAEEHDRVKHGL